MRHRSAHRRHFIGIVTIILGGMVLASAAIKVAPAAAESDGRGNPLSQILTKENDILNAINNLPQPPPLPPTDLNGVTQNGDKNLPASSRFTVLPAFNNQAVRDNNTGLVWEQAPDTDGSRRWADATSYCATKSVGNTFGWRLPSVIELKSVQDPLLPPTFVPGPPIFSGVLTSAYWSASMYGALPDYVWFVYFTPSVNGRPDGDVQPNGKLGTSHTWCVRGPMNASAY